MCAAYAKSWGKAPCFVLSPPILYKAASVGLAANQCLLNSYCQQQHARPPLQGKERSFELQKLTPGAEYILAVKAIYDDASFVWSDSKAYRTLEKNKAQRQL
jgi:hypothetical protein